MLNFLTSFLDGINLLINCINRRLNGIDLLITGINQLRHSVSRLITGIHRLPNERALAILQNGNSLLDCIFFTMATARLMVMLIFTIRRRLQCWTSHACVLTCTQQQIMVCSYIITRCWGCLLGLLVILLMFARGVKARAAG